MKYDLSIHPGILRNISGYQVGCQMCFLYFHFKCKAYVSEYSKSSRSYDALKCKVKGN